MRAPLNSEACSDRSAAQPELEADLAAIYDRTVDDIYRFCLARSADADLAADATADVFFAAARSFANGSGAQVTRAWLFTVAKSRLIDHWRQASRHQRRVERLGRIAGRDEGTKDISDEVPAIAAADVVEALRSLPDRQRAALSLRYLDELSVAEIADELSIAYTAAESLLARGRRSFERAWVSQGRPHAERTSRQ